MKVHIPSPLQSYTHDAKLIDGSGPSVAALLDELERRYPGIRFRMIDEQDAIRRHIRIFVNGELVSSLDVDLAPHDEVHIICAISGG